MWINFWNKLLAAMLERHNQVKDKRFVELIWGIVPVKEEIKQAALREFLNQAQRLHTTSFLQWRWMFPSKVDFNQDLLETLINRRLA